MRLVDNDTFLEELANLFQSTKEKGTIWLTHKRLTHDGTDAVMQSQDGEDDDREYQCLVRVTDGKRTKFSTKVDSRQLSRFHSAYGTLLKASMTTLRKRDKKREKLRAEQLANRKRRMAEPVVIEGPKRGNGRKKRQRKIKAAMKQEEIKQRIHERESNKGKNTSK